MRKRRNLVGLERTSPFLSAGGGGESGGDELLPVVFSHFVRSRFVRFWVPTCFSAVSGAKKLGSASSCVVLYRAFSAMVQCTKGVQFISVPEQLLAEGKVIIKSLHV
jgi:hypothetical protein